MKCHPAFAPRHGAASGGATPPPDGGRVWIGIITESFPPEVNGVANSVLRVAAHLLTRGHQPLVIAPEPSPGSPAAADPPGYPVLRVPSVSFPGYRAVRLRFGPGPGTTQIRGWLADHHADLVHLASPFILGALGPQAARELGCRGLPSTRPTCPATPAPTIAAAPPRRSPGAGSAGSTTGRPAPGPVHRQCATAPGARRRAGVDAGPRRGLPAVPPVGPGARSCAARWRPAGRPSSGTWGGWPTRSRLTCWPRWPGCCPGHGSSSWAAGPPRPGCAC